VDTSKVTHADAYHASASNPVVYARHNDHAPRGWYVDLPASGERLLVHPQPFLGRKVIFTTSAPSDASAEESCDPLDAGGQHWLNVRDMITGQPPAGGVFHTTHTSTSIDAATRARIGSNEFVLLPGQADRFRIAQTGGSKHGGGRVAPEELKDVAPAPARADWRELRP
jgi:Tfp pilus tip-associated adhesin PilY1